MTKKFLNKYRIDSARLPKWNYGNNGSYFITICTHNFHHYFGEIVEGEMKLSPEGIIATESWNDIVNHSQYTELKAFIAMPNHIHGIINIVRPFDIEYEKNCDNLLAENRKGNIGENTIHSIIGSYKSAVSRKIHKEGRQFKWQERFHDHIIKDIEAYGTIYNYIINNPKTWFEDRINQNSKNNIRK